MIPDEKKKLIEATYLEWYYSKQGVKAQPLLPYDMDIIQYGTQCYSLAQQEIAELKEQYQLMDTRRHNAIKSLEESEKQFEQLQEELNIANKKLEYYER